MAELATMTTGGYPTVFGTETIPPEDRGPRMPDHDRTMPNFRVTLTEELRDLVDEKAREIARPGEKPNRSMAIREILREWAATRPQGPKKKGGRAGR